MRKGWFLILCLLVCTSCYYEKKDQTLYEVNDNFVLKTDSVLLQTQQPLHNQPVDTLSDTVLLRRHDELVVAQIQVIPEDSVDSVWVKVAHDQYTMGWLHQTVFLQSVVPDDPISQFIDLFSQRHLWYFIGLIFAAMALLLWRQMRHSHFHMICLNDIPSSYPTLLLTVFNGSAVLYASIQRLVPETWVQYYYHPTLNPFDLPFVLGLFLASIWLMLILMLAMVDEVFRQLTFVEAVLYLFSLMGVCLVCYLVFTLAALSWLGYVLYAIGSVLLFCRYYRYFRPRYVCGGCGAKMHDLGRCSRCGAENRAPTAGHIPGSTHKITTSSKVGTIR